MPTDDLLHMHWPVGDISDLPKGLPRAEIFL
jgi:hypothetical protein